MAINHKEAIHLPFSLADKFNRILLGSYYNQLYSTQSLQEQLSEESQLKQPEVSVKPERTTIYHLNRSYFNSSYLEYAIKEAELSSADTNLIKQLGNYLYERFKCPYKDEDGYEYMSGSKSQWKNIAAKLVLQSRKPYRYERCLVLEALLTNVFDVRGLNVTNQYKLRGYLQVLSDRFKVPIINYYDECVQMGYQFNYFEFINPHNIYVKAMLGQLELTPESFEQAAISNYHDYDRMIDKLRRLPHQPILVDFDRPSEVVKFLDSLGPDHQIKQLRDRYLSLINEFQTTYGIHTITSMNALDDLIKHQRSTKLQTSSNDQHGYDYDYNYEFIYKPLIESIQQLSTVRQKKYVINWHDKSKDPQFRLEGERPENLNRQLKYSRSRRDMKSRLGQTRYGWSRNMLRQKLAKLNGSSASSHRLTYLDMLDQLRDRPTQPSIYMWTRKEQIKRLKEIKEKIQKVFTELELDTPSSYYKIYEAYLESLNEMSSEVAITVTLTKEEVKLVGEYYWITMQLPGIYGYTKMPDHYETYFDKCYYEMVYRHINRTSQYFNWPLICQRKLLNQSSLSNLVYYDLSIDPQNLSYQSLCNLLSLVGRQRLSKETQEELAEIIEPLKYQPGSKLVNYERRTTFGTQSTPDSIITNLAKAELMKYCEEDKYTLDDVYQIMEELGFPSIRGHSIREIKNKAELCQILKQIAQVYFDNRLTLTK